MKKWEEYEYNVPLPDNLGHLRALVKEIDEQLLTAKQRTDAVEAARLQTQAWERAELEQQHKDFQAKQQEFFDDCREDIGYDDVLTEDGCKKLESFASELAEDESLANHHETLVSLFDMFQALLKHVK